MPTASMRAALGLVMLMGNAAAPTVLAEVAPMLPALQQRVKRAGSVDRSYTGTDGTATMPTAAMRDRVKYTSRALARTLECSHMDPI